MFTDEARILGLIHHPNVVQAFEFGEERRDPVPGARVRRGSIAGARARAAGANRRMPPAIAAYLGREIAARSTACTGCEDVDGTRSELVHRDVTPSNIIVTPWGGGEAARLRDREVRERGADRPARGPSKGSPATWRPSSCDGQAIDGRVDLFALGIVLHELFLRQHLFAGESDLAHR